jgi:hypothetical protein
VRGDSRTLRAVSNLAAKAWTPIVDVSSVKIAGEASVPGSALSGLPGFVATGYLAVIVN